MATDITMNQLTNGSVTIVDGEASWSGDGVFDKLIDAVNKNIEVQHKNNRITDTDFANVYLGSIQAVLQQSIQYILSERKLEVEIDNAIAQGNLISAQISEAIASTDRANKQLEDTLLTSEKQRLSIDKDNLLKDDELLINEKKKDQLDAQIAEVLDGTNRANAQLDDSLLTSEKQRILLDTEEEIKQYERDTLQVDAHNTNLKQQTKLDEDLNMAKAQTTEVMSSTIRNDADSKSKIALTDNQISDIVKGIAVKDQQIETMLNDDILKIEQFKDSVQTNIIQRSILGVDKDIKEYERDTLQLDTHNMHIKQIEEISSDSIRKDSQLDDAIKTNSKQRELVEQQLLDTIKSTEVKSKQIESMAEDDVLKRDQFNDSVLTNNEQRDKIRKETTNLDNVDLLTLAQIGKTKISADVEAVLGSKDADIKDMEYRVVAQRYSGRNK